MYCRVALRAGIPGGRQQLKRHLPELEALRGFAALYVFLHHARLAPNSGLGALFYFGQEAVILFFLLSGFVIYLSTIRSGVRGYTYLVHRARRIYPMVIAALVLAYLSSAVGARAWIDPHLGNLAMNLLMLQDVSSLKRGVWADTYYGNTPLWSLSYEWWFYMLFVPLGLMGRRSGGANLTVAFLLSAAGALTYQWHPNAASLFASYFIIWWVGVELAREYAASGAVTFIGQWKSLGALLFCAVLWAIPVLVAFNHGESLKPGFDPVLQFRHFAAALLFCVLGLAWRRARLFGFRALFGKFAVLAPISYSLYLTHVPVLKLAAELFPGSPLLTAVVALIAIVPASNLAEVRFQRVINRWSDRVLASARERRANNAASLKSVTQHS